MLPDPQADVRKRLQAFQDGYTARDVSRLDDFIMKAIFDQDNLSADEKLIEVTHFGMRRLRERSKGLGYSWPFTFTAVLVAGEHGGWRFHTLHWAMPVD